MGTLVRSLPRSSLRSHISSVAGHAECSMAVGSCKPCWFYNTLRWKSHAGPPSSTENRKPFFRWLDLKGSGLSMLERLSLEEYLLKHTQDNWILVGSHSVGPHKYIRMVQEEAGAAVSTQSQSSFKRLPDYILQRDGGLPNPKGMIVMGIGGKAERLLNSHTVINDGMLVVKRFSGGGTVVMDENAIWTTLVAGRKDSTDMELCKPYPRDIMKWTADAIFGPTFDKLNTCVQAQEAPVFSLREDDYVLKLQQETRKMGGNAQAITGKQGWLHHTSFLWDYKDTNMEAYLKLPEKRPEYRRSRTHKDFLVKLKDHYGNDPSVFVQAMKEACSESIGIEDTEWSTVHRELFGPDSTAFQTWWIENRTRIQHNL